MDRRSIARLTLALLLATAAALTFTTTVALAARGHVFDKSFSEKGTGNGQLEGPAGIAINEEKDYVYVLDAGNHRVEYFNGATDAYVGQFNGSATPAGSFEYPEHPGGIAVDNDPGSPSHGDVYVIDTGHAVIDKFGPEGKYIGQITGTSQGSFVRGGIEGTVDGLYSVAVDAAGNVWVSSLNDGPYPGIEGTRVYRFNNQVVNEFKGEVTSRPLEQGTVELGLAADSEDNLYVNLWVGNTEDFIAELSSSGEEISGAWDHNAIDTEPPSGVAVEFPSNDVYIDNATSIRVFSPDGVRELERLTVPGGAGGAVGVDGKTGRVYVEDTSADRIEEFELEPPGPPTLGLGLTKESIAKITAESVVFSAEINPRSEPDEEPTEYRFEYGPCAGGTESCASSPYESSVPVPAGELAPNYALDTVTAAVQDLRADTVYHFRVIAHNGFDPVEPVEGEEQTFTTQPPGGSLVLPDDRQWELVSPPNKFGALIYPINEFAGVIQAAADGNAITYGTSDVTELQPRGSTYHLVQVLSRRGAGASSWSSQDIETPNNYETGVRINIGYEYRFFSSDLSLALLQPEGAFTPLERDGVSEEVPPRATERTAYLRSDFTCQATPATCYTPLVTEANTPPETKIGGNEESLFGGAVEFVGATPDLSHVVLTSNEVPLIEGAAHRALYEWAGGRLQPVSVLPLSEGGAWVEYAELGGLATGDQEARNAISTDGSRVVWSDAGDHGLYMSDTTGGKTESVRIGGAGAQFMDASSDDSKVFFQQGGSLNNEGEEGGDLYAFEVTSGEGEPLAGTVTRMTEGAEVQGTVLGASEDGSYVYFVAQGVLGDGAAHGATTGDCGLGRVEGSAQRCNLYVEHYNSESKRWEAPSFIAALSGADFPDWSTLVLRTHTSRASPNGRYLAFISNRSLTGYDNDDVNSGVPDEEVFLFDAATGRLVCASCNPTGARPVGVKVEEAAFVDDEMWGAGTWLSANVPGFTPYHNQRALYQSRYLSNSGRLFFNSHEALVPQDVNGQWDVYEYEPPGIGDCSAVDVTFSPRSGGCVGLVSSGESAQESAFLDASENGDDVFFLTTSRLSSQDFDDDYDVYDAHVCGAEGVACAPMVTPPPPCTTEASCKPAPTPQPTLYAPPASATFSGPGNLAPPPPAPVRVAKKKTVKCVRGRVRDKRGVCVKQKSKKREAKKASDDRRAGR
jgi:hypothetical protein